MSTSDDVYAARRRSRCHADPGRVGHLGWRTTERGGLQPIGPNRCPNGHALRYGTVVTGWTGSVHYYLCRTCEARLLYCGCRGDLYATGHTEPLECETELPAS